MLREPNPHRGIVFESSKPRSRYMTDDVPNCVYDIDCCLLLLWVLVLFVLLLLLCLCLLWIELHVFVCIYFVFLFLCRLFCYKVPSFIGFYRFIVCMYLSIHICVCPCMHVYVHVCMHLCLYVCVTKKIARIRGEN